MSFIIFHMWTLTANQNSKSKCVYPCDHSAEGCDVAFTLDFLICAASVTSTETIQKTIRAAIIMQINTLKNSSAHDVLNANYIMKKKKEWWKKYTCTRIYRMKKNKLWKFSEELLCQSEHLRSNLRLFIGLHFKVCSGVFLSVQNFAKLSKYLQKNIRIAAGFD